MILPALGKCKIRTKIKAYMQEDEVLIIHPRSSQGIKQKVRLQNTTGIVDSDYYNNQDNEGEIIIFLENRSQKDINISKGDIISQAMFQKFLLTDSRNHFLCPMTCLPYLLHCLGSCALNY